MSKLNELINRLCPEGVEYKMLSDLCITLQKETLKTNELLKNGKYPVINSGREFYGMYNKFNNEKNAFTLAARGEYAGFVNYLDIDFWAGGLCYPYRSKDENIIKTKFVYYYLKSKQNYIMGTLVTRGSIPAINKCDIDRILLPLPPLEVQNEIVSILDNFTELSEELSAELKARQKQYEYYRSILFEKNINNVVELENIGDVTKLAGFEFTKYVNYTDTGNIIALRGLNVKDGRIILNDVKYIDTSDFSKLDRSKLYCNDILYTYVGTVGQVGLVDKNDKYYLAPNVARIRITNKNIIPKFVMYFLQTPEFKANQLDKLSGSSSMKNITMTNIRKFKIPIPPLSEQKRIVNILDKFDKLCNDISRGIPAEIEARQKQYEYYRDKLLNFKELKVI